MARFVRIPIERGTPAQSRWGRIRDELVTSSSVEVVKVQEEDGTFSFELRAWANVRQDGSNGADAKIGRSY